MNLLRVTILPSPAPAPTPKVLVVDDDGRCRASLRAFVEYEGHACEAVASAAEARSWCAGARPSAVLTDLEMPGQDGRSLADWLRGEFPGIHLALVTGRELGPAELGELSGVFDAVLPKPVDTERLSALLAGWMARSLAPARP